MKYSSNSLIDLLHYAQCFTSFVLFLKHKENFYAFLSIKLKEQEKH